MNNSINGQASILNADLTNDELDDAQLEAFSGGMSCKTAVAIAKTYKLAAEVCLAFGDTTNAALMIGYEGGVLQGGCGKG